MSPSPEGARPQSIATITPEELEKLKERQAQLLCQTFRDAVYADNIDLVVSLLKSAEQKRTDGNPALHDKLRVVMRELVQELDAFNSRHAEPKLGSFLLKLIAELFEADARVTYVLDLVWRFSRSKFLDQVEQFNRFKA